MTGVTSAAVEANDAAPAVALAAPSTSVVVHPLVLLSTVDHYNRVARDTKRRVVGVLLGNTEGGRIDVLNSFAVPFEEDTKGGKDGKPPVWFLDHNFLEDMFGMFRKVTAKERVVGWYSTGPKIRANDLAIHQLFKRFCADPVMVIIDVQPQQEWDIPTSAYRTVEEVKEHSVPEVVFQHVPSEIGALEAEEVGVEHLLREISDPSLSSLSKSVQQQVKSMGSLVSHLQLMDRYLTDVAEGRLPLKKDIIDNMQDVFNLLPNIKFNAMQRAFQVKTNDTFLVLYVSSMVRAIIALHDLLNNKLEAQKREAAEAKGDSGEGDSGADGEDDGDDKGKEKSKEKSKEKENGHSKDGKKDAAKK